MSQANRARVERAGLNFFRVHKEVSSCDANFYILENKMDELLLDGTSAESWEIAYLAVSGQLAKAPAAPPEPAPEPVPPEPISEKVPTHEWSKERLRDYLKSHRNRRPTEEELKKSVKIPDQTRSERDKALSKLMAELTGAKQ